MNLLVMNLEKLLELLFVLFAHWLQLLLASSLMFNQPYRRDGHALLLAGDGAFSASPRVDHVTMELCAFVLVCMAKAPIYILPMWKCGCLLCEHN